MGSWLLNPHLVGFDANSIVGLNVWFDAQDDSTIDLDVSSDNWTSKAAAGFVGLSQATGSQRPVKTTVSSRQMLQFDGSADYLSAPDNALLDFGSSDFTWFLVFHTADANRGAICGKGATAGAAGYTCRVNDADTNNGDFVFFTRDSTITAATVVDTTENYNDDAVRLVTCKRDGNNLELYSDGTEVSSSPTDITGFGNIDTATSFFVGSLDASNHFLDGEIGEIVMYSNALSSADQTLVEDWLKGKWGIT